MHDSSNPLRDRAERLRQIEPTCRCSHDFGKPSHCRLPAGHLADHLPDGPLLNLSLGFAFAQEARLRFEEGKRSR